MDKKISDCAPLSTLSVTDILPIVSAGENYHITAGVLFNNIPNLKNSGMTRDVVNTVSSGTLDVTKTLIKLTGLAPYTMPSGNDGQVITLVSAVSGSTVNFTQSMLTTATLQLGGVVTVRFFTGLGWVVISKNNATTV